MGHYFESNENIKSDEKLHEVFIKEKRYKFITDYGVFSKKGLDYGTRVLLESIDIDNIDGDVLDFGCGYGPIGIFIKDNTNSNVDMIDVNERSISLAKKNASLNNVNVNIFYSDRYENINKKYDYIISNPPIRVGNEILFEILFGAKDYLKKGGKLIIVINKNQGAKTVVKKLADFFVVEVINKNKGFYIIEASNI